MGPIICFLGSFGDFLVVVVGEIKGSLPPPEIKKIAPSE